MADLVGAGDCSASFAMVSDASLWQNLVGTGACSASFTAWSDTSLVHAAAEAAASATFTVEAATSTMDMAAEATASAGFTGDASGRIGLSADGELASDFAASGNATIQHIAATPNLGVPYEMVGRDPREPTEAIVWCAKTGQPMPASMAVVDGYTGLLVHPDNYDPPEPRRRRRHSSRLGGWYGTMKA